jgi:hypothetical protein
MKDTPESNEHDQDYQTSGCNQISGATLDFCRKLERERDEAREQRDNYQLELQIVTERLKGNRHPDDNGMKYEGQIDIKAITEQRDRLAAVLQRIRDGYGGQLASPNCCEDCEFLIPIDEALQYLTMTKP